MRIARNILYVIRDRTLKLRKRTFLISEVIRLLHSFVDFNRMIHSNTTHIMFHARCTPRKSAPNFYHETCCIVCSGIRLKTTRQDKWMNETEPFMSFKCHSQEAVGISDWEFFWLASVKNRSHSSHNTSRSQSSSTEHLILFFVSHIQNTELQYLQGRHLVAAEAVIYLEIQCSVPLVSGIEIPLSFQP